MFVVAGAAVVVAVGAVEVGAEAAAVLAVVRTMTHPWKVAASVAEEAAVSGCNLLTSSALLTSNCRHHYHHTFQDGR